MYPVNLADRETKIYTKMYGNLIIKHIIKHYTIYNCLRNVAIPLRPNVVIHYLS